MTTAAPGAPRRRSASAPPVLRVPEADLSALVARARRLLAQGRRRLLGLAGAPGVGKSTVAARLVAALAGAAVLVPMDGFHLAEAELHRLGRHARKGAPDTFDAAGYVALLRRLRHPAPETVYAPRFDRGLEEPIAGAIPVPPELPLVVTEGNYLLVPAALGRGARAAGRGLVPGAGRAGAAGPVDRPARRPRPLPSGGGRPRPRQRPAQRRVDRHHPPPGRPDRPAHLRPGGGGGAGVSWRAAPG